MRLEVYAVARKRLSVWGVGLSLTIGLVGSAYADCGSDMQKLAQDRNTQLEIVNNFAKSFHGKPLDPTAFCAKSSGLVRAETALIADPTPPTTPSSTRKNAPSPAPIRGQS